VAVTKDLQKIQIAALDDVNRLQDAWIAVLRPLINPEAGAIVGFRWVIVPGANGAASTFALQVAQGEAWKTIATFNASGALVTGTIPGTHVTSNPMLSATTAAGQSIPNSIFTIVVYGTVERDTDSAYNSGTGSYTIPPGKGGDYSITGVINYAAAVAALNALSIFINGAEKKRIEDTSLAANGSLLVSGVLNLAAGDIVDIRTFQGSGVSKLLDASALTNYFTLKRIS